MASQILRNKVGWLDVRDHQSVLTSEEGALRAFARAGSVAAMRENPLRIRGVAARGGTFPTEPPCQYDTCGVFCEPLFFDTRRDIGHIARSHDRIEPKGQCGLIDPSDRTSSSRYSPNGQVKKSCCASRPDIRRSSPPITLVNNHDPSFHFVQSSSLRWSDLSRSALAQPS